MKKLFCILFLVLLTSAVAAQVAKTITVTTAGNLNSLLTSVEKTTVTNLTVTGSIDARDVKCLRDEMTVLAVLDLSEANIIAYTGTAGTYNTSSSTYPVNQMPMFSFYDMNISSKTTLVSVALPTSLTSIGNNAFSGCTGLTSIIIPKSVTSIGTAAFSYCAGLTSFTIPTSVTSIENWAFEYCTGLTSVIIPNSVTSIGNTAFYNCTSLTTITIPNSIISIGSYAFYGCTGLTSVIIPDSVTSIGNFAFSHCAGLTSVGIPSSVTSIGDYIFSACSGLTSITIPNATTSIGNFEFSECTGLISVTIPSSITSIGTGAFNRCTGLTSIYAYPTTPVNISSLNQFAFVSRTACTLYVPTGSKTAYQAATGWKNFSNIVEMTTAIPSVNDSNFSLYMNQMNNTIYINGLKGTLWVFDINGRQILTQQVAGNESVSIWSLPQSLYIVKLLTVEGMVERKVLKK